MQISNKSITNISNNNNSIGFRNIYIYIYWKINFKFSLKEKNIIHTHIYPDFDNKY